MKLPWTFAITLTASLLIATSPLANGAPIPAKTNESFAPRGIKGNPKMTPVEYATRILETPLDIDFDDVDIMQAIKQLSAACQKALGKKMPYNLENFGSLVIESPDKCGSQKVTLKAHQMTVSEIFDFLSKQTGCEFVFQHGTLFVLSQGSRSAENLATERAYFFAPKETIHLEKIHATKIESHVADLQIVVLSCTKRVVAVQLLRKDLPIIRETLKQLGLVEFAPVGSEVWLQQITPKK